MAAAAGTWAFSLPAVERMRQGLLQGGLATDCLQEAMADIENDGETGVFVVGRGGYPNKDGIIQCDAAIMEGHPGRFGAVAALHGIGAPLAVARKVMEETPHSFLAGEGAVAFAKDQGFTVEDNRSLMSKRGSEAYQEYLETKKSLKEHDTLGLIALDVYRNITVGKREQRGLGKAVQMQTPLVGCVGSPHPFEGREFRCLLTWREEAAIWEFLPLGLPLNIQDEWGILSCQDVGCLLTKSDGRGRQDHVLLSMFSYGPVNETGLVSCGRMPGRCPGYPPTNRKGKDV